jgi:hypothetical protein
VFLPRVTADVRADVSGNEGKEVEVKCYQVTNTDWLSKGIGAY